MSIYFDELNDTYSGELKDLKFKQNMARSLARVRKILDQNKQPQMADEVSHQYKDKYLLTVTARQDGSSRFGKNNKYGFFPSVGAGWKISEENFMKNASTFSNLKLRGSWGKTGNQEIGNFQTQQFFYFFEPIFQTTPK